MKYKNLETSINVVNENHREYRRAKKALKYINRKKKPSKKDLLAFIPTILIFWAFIFFAIEIVYFN